MKFVKGKSGNPSGRPRNTESEADKALNEKYMSTLREKVEKNIPAITDAMINLAINGDTKILLALNAMFFKRSPSLGKTLLTSTAAHIVESENIVLDALSNGEIEPNHADSILKHLVHHRDFLVVKTLEEKINRIDEEAKMEKEKGNQ